MLPRGKRLAVVCSLFVLALLALAGCSPQGGSSAAPASSASPSPGSEGGTPSTTTASSTPASTTSPVDANECGPSSGITAVPGSGVNWSPGSFPAPSFSGPLLTQINTHRATLGLAPLVWHDLLGLIAQQHDADMQNNNYFGLVGPSGVDICQQLVSSNPPVTFNDLFVFVTHFPNPGTPAQALSDLLANPAAKAAIENPAVTQFGSYYSSLYGTVLLGENVVP